MRFSQKNATVCVHYNGAMYEKLEVSDILAGRKAVSRETAKVAATVKETVQQHLKEPIVRRNCLIMSGHVY